MGRKNGDTRLGRRHHHQPVLFFLFFLCFSSFAIHVCNVGSAIIQAFTRHANALVLDPRDLKSVAGTLTRWMNGEGGNAMQTDGRVQTLLSTEQLAECDRWRDEHIVPAVADAWATKGAGMLSCGASVWGGRERGGNLQMNVRVAEGGSAHPFQGRMMRTM